MTKYRCQYGDFSEIEVEVDTWQEAELIALRRIASNAGIYVSVTELCDECHIDVEDDPSEYLVNCSIHGQ
jgi:hypothetical protein